MESILTPGEWEALLYQVPNQIRHLAYRLAIHHGVVERPRPAECPLCAEPKVQGVLKFNPVLPDGPAERDAHG